MTNFNWFKKTTVRTTSKTTPLAKYVRLEVEPLESRLVPYAVSGNAWIHPELITISFVPDGTSIDGQTSNLQATFNAKFGSATVWQNAFKKAAQAWAEQTNINVVFVSDNGDPVGSGSYQQGDANFGDIRIGGYDFQSGSILGSANMPPPINNLSYAGDIAFNTAQTFNIGSAFDVFTVAAHEFGHGMGLYHGAAGSVMASGYNANFTALTTDDINGIRQIYSAGAARAKDSYDAAAANETFATAVNITSTIDTTTKTALVTNLDLTTRTDVDWYKITIPAGSSTTLTAKAVATGLSMLNPKIDIYNSSNQLKATNNGGAWGSTASASFNGVSAGQVWYVKVSSIDSTGQFKTGRYALVLNMGTGADPTVPLPNTQELNGDPPSIGGGQALAYSPETLVNTITAGDQSTANAQPALAMDADGNYVAIWSSQNQDSTGSWGVYGQRFNALGVAQGREFRINATTAGDQLSPSVAMASNGDFVVSWSSFNQDARNTWGVFAQRFNTAGVPQGNEFRVNTTSAGDQMYSAAAMAGNGDFVISWSSFNQDAFGTWGVYAQRFNATGVPQGGEFRVNTLTQGDQMNSSVAMNATGDFIVSWSSRAYDAASVDAAGSNLNRTWDIRAQRFNGAGVAQGSEFRINTTVAGDQSDSAVTFAANGSFVAVWSSVGQDGSGQGIYAQRFDANGAPLRDEVLVNTTTVGDQATPAVASDPFGGFVVTWASEGQDGSGWGIYAQQFGSSGAPLEEEFGVNTTTKGNQVAPAVLLDNLGRLTIAWSGNGDGDTQGVFARRFSTSTDVYTIGRIRPVLASAADVSPYSFDSLLANLPSNFWEHWSGSSPFSSFPTNTNGANVLAVLTALETSDADSGDPFAFLKDHNLSDRDVADDFFARLSASLDEDGDIGAKQENA